MIALPNAQPSSNRVNPFRPKGRKLLAEFAEVAVLTAAEKQVKGMLEMIGRFYWSKAGRSPTGITTAAVENHLAALSQRGLAPATLRNVKSVLSRWCHFLIGRGMLAANPCQHVTLRKPEQQLPRWLTVAEVREVLQIAQERGMWAEVRLALSTGLRLGELIRLQWEHIDLDRRCLTVFKSKTRRPRVVPLSDAALAALEAQRRRSAEFDFVFPARHTWRAGWRYENRRRAANWWHRSLAPIKAAVPKFNSLPGCSTGRGWHLFRHTFASRAVQQGVSLYRVGSWLGHSDAKTTQIYAHLAIGYDPEIEKASEADEPGGEGQ